MAEGKLRTVVDSASPLKDVAKAMDHLAEGHARGKIIINP